MKVKLLASATDDLYDGYRFYERQTPGLGTHYFKALFSDIDSLENHAGIHPIHFGFHRLLSKRFPYAVFYKIEGTLVIVKRILDTRRDPDQIKRALE
jgi:plasmid stabilization system protein ParE